eukprot:2741776-Rhodomonas_salina.1
MMCAANAGVWRCSARSVSLCCCRASSCDGVLKECAALVSVIIIIIIIIIIVIIVIMRWNTEERVLHCPRSSSSSSCDEALKECGARAEFDPLMRMPDGSKSPCPTK